MIPREQVFYLNRPADWNGTTPVKVTHTFALGSNIAGTVNWRMRLNTYTPGGEELLTNPAARDADSLLTFALGPSSLRIYSQGFGIEASRLSTEPIWSMFFQ